MNQISLFANHRATESQESITIDNFLSMIRNGRWQSQVEHLRSCNSKDEKDEIKRSLPAVTLSGEFRYRNREGLIKHSEFICIDVDYEIDRKTIESDPYTYSCFDSVSKRGLAIVVKINAEKHEESFSFLQKYYFESYGISIDPAPKSIVSLRCISWDENLVINTKSKVSKTYIPKKPKYSPLPLVLSDEEVAQVVRNCVSAGINLAPDYESYYQLAFAFARGLGEGGRDYFHQICSIDEKYKHDQADKKFSDALKNVASQGRSITLGSFYYLAKQAGIEIPKTNKEAVGIAAIAKKSGKNKDAVAEHLVTVSKIKPNLAAKIASEVFERDDITLKTLASDPEHLIESLCQFIKANYPLRRNDITLKIEFIKSGKTLTEEDINDMYLHSRAAFNTPHINKDLIQSILFSSQTPNYNPIISFIDRNLHRTTTGHIDKLISAINTTTPFAKNFIRKWIISIHAAIEWNPVRLMLTFTGPQYNGKTEFFRRLLPTELNTFYAESKLDRGKDDELLMCQKLIVMDDEMGGKSKQDEKRLKELTSKRFFTLRAPYRRDNMDYRRLAVLCGTSNPTEIMNDPTGNTRILPVKVDSIDYQLLNSVNRTDLFMEAYHAYVNGESWELSQDEVADLNLLSDGFSNIAFERELILKFFEPEGVDKLTATEIKNEIETNSKQQIKNMQRFGIELRKIFGDPKSVKRGFSVVKCYSLSRTYENTAGSNYPPSTSNYHEPAKDQELPF